MGTLLKLETLKDLLKEHIEHFKEIFREDPNHDPIPVVIGYTATSKMVIVVPDIGGPHKEQCLRMVSTLFAAHNVKRYTIATLGWSLEGENPQEEYDKLAKEGKKIEDSPNRMEVLTCMAVSHTECILALYKVNPDRTIEDTPHIEGPSGGRLAELLPPKDMPDEVREALKKMLQDFKIPFTEETLQ